MKRFAPLILLFLAHQSFGQCNPSVIWNNDSTHAVCIDTVGFVINIYTNNYPDHSWGTWPSNSPVLAQDFEYHVCAFPQKAQQPTSIYDAPTVGINCRPQVQFGVGLNGIFYSGWGARWFVNPQTQQENLSWNVEPLAVFNMDFNNAHSNNPGEYHYHGIPDSYFGDSLEIDSTAHSPLVGYAADGFPIYYKYVYADPTLPSAGITGLTSGYTIKAGNRPGDSITAPGGAYNGLYVEDYEYANPNWDLDECNGRFGITPEFPNGTYYYVLTDNWPYIPRCFYGTLIDNSFRIGNGCPASTADVDCSGPVLSNFQVLNEANVIVFPNPSQGRIQISGLPEGLEGEKVSLYDLNGKIWYHSEKVMESIDLSDLSTGSYFLQITAGGAQVTKKIIVGK